MTGRPLRDMNPVWFENRPPPIPRSMDPEWAEDDSYPLDDPRSPAWPGSDDVELDPLICSPFDDPEDQ